MKTIIPLMLVSKAFRFITKAYLIIPLCLIIQSCSPPKIGDDFGDVGCLGCFPRNQINIYTSGIDPDTLTVQNGATIIWDNWCDYKHILSSTDGISIYDTIPAMSEFKYTTKKVGTLEYHCTIHNETGVLIVTR